MFDITRGYSLKLSSSMTQVLSEELRNWLLGISSRCPIEFRGKPFILAIFSRSNINQHINIKHIDTHSHLVGGFKHFLFSIIYGIILPIIFFKMVKTTNQSYSHMMRTFPSLSRACSKANKNPWLPGIGWIIELDDGKIYRKTLYVMVKTMVSG